MLFLLGTGLSIGHCMAVEDMMFLASVRVTDSLAVKHHFLSYTIMYRE